MPKVWNMRDPNKPKDAIYVGRSMPKIGVMTTKYRWGNPYVIGEDGTREEVIEKYKRWIESRLQQHLVDLSELKGKDLVCWCHNWDGIGKNPYYCHADILLELANK